MLVRCPIKGCGRIAAEILEVGETIEVRPRRISAQDALQPEKGRVGFDKASEQEISQLWRYRRPVVTDEGALGVACEEHDETIPLRVPWRDVASALASGATEVVALHKARR